MGGQTAQEGLLTWAKISASILSPSGSVGTSEDDYDLGRPGYIRRWCKGHR